MTDWMKAMKEEKIDFYNRGYLPFSRRASPFIIYQYDRTRDYRRNY